LLSINKKTKILFKIINYRINILKENKRKMISIIGQGATQTDEQRDAQIPTSLKTQQHQLSITQTKFASRKLLSILLVIASIVFCICATILAITYGMLYAKTFGDNRNEKKSEEMLSVLSDYSKDARFWPFNNLNIQKSTCGLQTITPKLSRIINGVEAVPHSWPWMVTIGLFGPKLNLLHACGGSIISKRYILTAAHCVNL
jgi:hypothetical protein